VEGAQAHRRGTTPAVGVRLPGLDGIRAISIALVILFHVSTSAAGRPSMGFGGFGVDIFFVLSGFLITWLLCCEERQHNSISLPSFYARRALRILPPAMAYLAILLVLSGFRRATVRPADIFSCLFFFRNMFQGGSESTAHYWSLSVEEQFYLIWPLALILLRSNRARLRFSIVLLLVAPFWQILCHRLAGGAEFVNHARFDQIYERILIGCCLALIRNEPGLSKYWRGPALQSRWMPLVAIAGIVASLEVPHLERIGYICVALVLNYAVEHPGGVLNWGPMVWVGKLSYSLYIWQQLFCWGSPLGRLGRFPQNVVATLIAASLSYYLVEMPFTNLRKRIRFIPNPAPFSRIRSCEETIREAAEA
jgi:peptidoglycan/LPS O-acetylase OafA/YrhL